MKIVIEMEPQMWALVREGHIPVRAYECIVKGTPLPKGHGRLIDADALYEQYAYTDYNFDMTMEYAPTIIEADAESEENNGTL